MKKLIKNILKHFLVIIIFTVISIVFFFPILDGKKILQNDIVQYSGMSKELKDFRAQNNEETYCATTSKFSIDSSLTEESDCQTQK